MNQREEVREGKRVTVIERGIPPFELERMDLLARLKALEQHAAKTGYKPPAPAKGFVRRQVGQH